MTYTATWKFENGEKRVVETVAGTIPSAQIAYLTSGDRVKSQVVDVEVVDDEGQVVAYAERRFSESLGMMALVVKEG